MLFYLLMLLNLSCGDTAGGRSEETLIEILVKEEERLKNGLNKAIEKGNLKEFKKLFAKYVDNNTKQLCEGDKISINSLGNRFLNDACRLCKKEIVEFLLNEGVAADTYSFSDNKTPLIYAVENTGDLSLKVVQLLLSKGADIKKKDHLGGTVLMYAVREDVINYLLEIDKDLPRKTEIDNITVLMYLAESGKSEAVNFWINKIKAESKESLKQELEIKGGSYERTPLQYAVAGGHIEVFKILVKQGANKLGIRDSVGNTLLMIAVRRNKLEMVKFLLEDKDILGTLEDGNSNTGYTALRLSKESKNKDIEKFLLEAGATKLNN